MCGQFDVGGSTNSSTPQACQRRPLRSKAMVGVTPPQPIQRQESFEFDHACHVLSPPLFVAG
jgi:hypothetical protein